MKSIAYEYRDPATFELTIHVIWAEEIYKGAILFNQQPIKRINEIIHQYAQKYLYDLIDCPETWTKFWECLADKLTAEFNENDDLIRMKARLVKPLYLHVG